MSRIFLNKEDNMFFKSHNLLILLLIIFAGCGKKKDAKLANTYFKLAFNDLADASKTNATYQNALQHINQALTLANKPEYLALKGTILMQLGHLQASHECFKQALTLPIEDNGLREQILNNQACLFALSGNTDQARAVWQELSASPDYTTPEVAWVNIGKLQLSGQHFGSAAEAFKTAALLEPNYVDAHFYAAIAAHAAGHNRQAHEALKTVLLLEPEHQAARALACRLTKVA
jgi:tetratricopeptide (TPR) repeat protein